MTNRLRLLVASLALGAAATVHAESVPTRTTPGRSTAPLQAVLDSDRDGALSVREIAAAPIALTALDLNEDGMISADERRDNFAEGRPLRAWRGGTAFNLLLALDANHDGVIQSIEIANAASSLKRLDLNGDGALTSAELRPVMVAQSR